MGIYDFTLYDVICRNAIVFNNKTAWFEADDDRTASFNEIKEQVEKLANGLQLAGVKKGDRLGILGKNSLEYFLVYGATAALGAIAVPINWRLSASEVAFNLKDCQPVAVFADPEYEELIQGVKDELASVKHCYGLTPGQGEFKSIHNLMENHDHGNLPDVSTDDGFVIIHTAAVTGRPRGALLSHGNVLYANMHLISLFKLSPRDVHLNLLPLYHVSGLFMMTQSFQAGITNINMRKFDAGTAVSLIESKKASILFDFSPILSAIMDAHETSGKDIRSLRAVIGLDSPELIEKYQKLTGGTFYSIYGQTETSALATLGQYNDRPGSAGKPIQLAQVQCVDDNDQPVAPGETGEIVMKGPMVFKGYWCLPEDTTHTFRGGWHHTGDLGRFDNDGYLFYVGRNAEKELIKPGGENVYPAEVERIILEHPDVERTVVFGVPDPEWKEGIKAVCQVKKKSSLKPGAITEFVGQRIARFKKPRYVEFVENFPLLKDGSADRVKIKSLYGENTTAS